MKPRIKLVKTNKVFGDYSYWQCSHALSPVLGGGETPMQAYYDWLENEPYTYRGEQDSIGEA